MAIYQIHNDIKKMSCMIGLMYKPMLHSMSNSRVLGDFSANMPAWRVFAEFLASFWRVLGRFLASSRLVLGEFLVSFWRVLGNFMASFRGVLDRFLASAWQGPGECFVNA